MNYIEYKECHNSNNFKDRIELEIDKYLSLIKENILDEEKVFIYQGYIERLIKNYIVVERMKRRNVYEKN